MYLMESTTKAAPSRRFSTMICGVARTPAPRTAPLSLSSANSGPWYQLLREPPGPEKDSKKESLLIIVLVVVFFLLLWGPSMLYTVLSSLTGQYLYIENDAVNPMKILSRSNALCTPSLYLCASPSLRKAVWETVWSKICCCKRLGRRDILREMDSVGQTVPKMQEEGERSVHSMSLPVGESCTQEGRVGNCVE
ncbi:uncharacterized protein AKAME5_000689000 [Lates japonicus]|uniref:Uncharacterized protein n=1 Tax=Lates japonicus TaxID=270547 RepID=A0AAD3R3Y5_LATJO|nr:uncharacterized protein AKAME5_000689000 [Lates japonicus]